MQKVVITIAVICTLAGFVFSHAGLQLPNPRGEECSASTTLNACGKVLAPCGGDTVGTRTKVAYGAYNVGVFQKIAHGTGNTYTIQIAKTEAGPWTELTVKVQDDGEDSISLTIPVTIPTSVPSGNATVRMIFDATNGGGDVYYSCADIILGNSVARVMISSVVLVFAIFALLF